MHEWSIRVQPPLRPPLAHRLSRYVFQRGTGDQAFHRAVARSGALSIIHTSRDALRKR